MKNPEEAEEKIKALKLALRASYTTIIQSPDVSVLMASVVRALEALRGKDGKAMFGERGRSDARS